MQRTVLFRIATVAAPLIFHRHVLFYPDHLFPWDFRAVNLPLVTLISDSFRHGQWPLWDPFTYCGMPIFANIQAGSFYPPVIASAGVAALLGDGYLPRLLAISVVAQIVFAGLCAFELMRKLEVRPAAAWIAATIFELGCFFAAQAEHIGAIQAAAWLPLIWLSVLHLRNFSRKWLAILIVSLAMTILAGLPQVALAAFASAVCLTALLALFRQANWRLSGVTVGACICGVLLASIQFLPTAELTQNSVAKYRAEWLGTGGGIPPSALLSLVIPNYWGVFNPSTFRGPMDLTFLFLYSSLLGLALALGAIFWKPAKWDRPFAALLAIFTLIMLGDKTVIGRAALASLPVQIRIGIHPEFFSCVFSLGLAVLAGLGAERLLRSSRAQVAVGVIIACDLIVVSSGRPMNEESSKTNPGMTQNAADGSPELLARLRALLNQTVPPARFDTRPDVSYLWSSTAPVLGIPTSNGCDPLAPERTIELRRAFANGPRWGTCYQVENPNSPVLGLMNARVLVSHSELTVPGLRLAGEAAGYKIYENVNAFDRFFFAKEVRTVNNLAAASAIVRSPDFRPREVTIVEAHGEQIATSPDESRVRVLSYEPTDIRLESKTQGSAFLVAADSYYPGWRASVDGQPARIYPSDAAFRGIIVPAGSHAVEFRFVPRTLYLSAAVSGATLIGVLLLCCL